MPLLQHGSAWAVVDALVTDLTRRLCGDGNLSLTGEEIQQSVSPVDRTAEILKC